VLSLLRNFSCHVLWYWQGKQAYPWRRTIFLLVYFKRRITMWCTDFCRQPFTFKIKSTKTGGSLLLAKLNSIWLENIIVFMGSIRNIWVQQMTNMTKARYVFYAYVYKTIKPSHL